jgi:hypothetical protein
MRVDYEQHLVECAHCRGRQRLHRTIDVTLIGLSTLSVLAFLLALTILHHVQPWQHWAVAHLYLHDKEVVLTMETAAILGLLVSLVAWLLVAITTPAPVYLTGMALTHARGLRVAEAITHPRRPRNVA